MRSVHYLVNAEDDDRLGLVYPTELGDKKHYAFGGFFLVGEHDASPEAEYVFHAVHGDNLLRTIAMRSHSGGRFFRVEVNGIGVYMFYAQPMPMKLPYIGGSPGLQGLFATRRLLPLKPDALDRACERFGFYFVGTSLRTE